MKKLVALILTLGLLAACVSALGLESSDVFGAFDTNDSGSWGAPFDHSVWKKIAGFQLKQDATITAILYDDDGNYFNTLIDNEAIKSGYVVVNWPGVNENGWHPGKGEEQNFLLTVTAKVGEESITANYIPFPNPRPFVFAHGIEEHIDYQWYPNNTICVAGLEFREVKPEVTSKWYNFAPIDLSEDGTQTFELVASNLFVIGKAIVTVSGDDVTVEWLLNKQGTEDANFESESEFLTFFHSIDDVTAVEPSQYEGPTYEFGQTISIANDLDGDTNVLLYIRNTATYCTNLSYQYQRPIYHAEYDRDASFRQARRVEMTNLMNADTAE